MIPLIGPLIGGLSKIPWGKIFGGGKGKYRDNGAKNRILQKGRENGNNVRESGSGRI